MKNLQQLSDEEKEREINSLFQDIVHDVFQVSRKANIYERAILRNRLIGLSSTILDATGGTSEDASELIGSSGLMRKAGLFEKSTISCNDKQPRITDESSGYINLEISPSTSKQASKLLEESCREEDVQFSWDNNDANKVPSKKQLSYCFSDKYQDLMVSFKRFEYDNYGHVAKKIDNDIEVDNITLPNVDNEGGKQDYTPTAFIVHRGTIEGGHYVVYIKEGNNRWYCYNDSSRTEVIGANLENGFPKEMKQAYIVKYSPTHLANNCDHLPASQQNGTTNGGNYCWANAAMAFMLSFTKLHDKNHVRRQDPFNNKNNDHENKVAKGIKLIEGELSYSGKIKNIKELGLNDEWAKIFYQAVVDNFIADTLKQASGIDASNVEELSNMLSLLRELDTTKDNIEHDIETVIGLIKGTEDLIKETENSTQNMNQNNNGSNQTSKPAVTTDAVKRIKKLFADKKVEQLIKDQKNQAKTKVPEKIQPLKKLDDKTMGRFFERIEKEEGGEKKEYLVRKETEWRKAVRGYYFHGRYVDKEIEKKYGLQKDENHKVIGEPDPSPIVQVLNVCAMNGTRIDLSHNK